MTSVAVQARQKGRLAVQTIIVSPVVQNIDVEHPNRQVLFCLACAWLVHAVLLERRDYEGIA